jgi:hypothetical protein
LLDWSLARRQRQYPRGASLTLDDGDDDHNKALKQPAEGDDFSGYINSSLLSGQLNFVGFAIGLICIFDTVIYRYIDISGGGVFSSQRCEQTINEYITMLHVCVW